MLRKESKMLLLLKSTVKGIGVVGDLVKVRPGHARNFLLAKGGNAVRATKQNIADFEKRCSDIEVQRKEELSIAQSVFDQINAVGSINITCNATEDGKLFGSVTNRDVADLLKAKEINISPKDVSIRGIVRHVGEYNVNVYLHPTLTAVLVLKVQKK